MAKLITINGGKVLYENGVHLGDVVMDVDGYRYFWPDMSRGGHWGAHVLREIADLLDELNEAWDAEVREGLTRLAPPA